MKLVTWIITHYIFDPSVIPAELFDARPHGFHGGSPCYHCCIVCVWNVPFDDSRQVAMRHRLGSGTRHEIVQVLVVYPGVKPVLEFGM